MRRRVLLAIGACTGATVLAPAGLEAASGGRPRTAITRRGLSFDTPVSITVVHADAALAAHAAIEALREIATVDRLMTVQRPGSEVARLNETGELANADPRLIEVLQAARRWHEASGGAFDVSVQPLWALFEQARARRTLPDADQVRAARARIDGRAIEIDGMRVRLRQPGMAITLNGIIQGYAADRALAVLRGVGIADALIDAGEFMASGRRPDTRPWQVGVRDPRRADAILARIPLADRALSSSGDDGYAFSDDRRHHHIFDPASGYSPADLAAATATAARAIDADALSTALLVAGPERAAALLAHAPGSEAWLVDKQGRMRRLRAGAAGHTAKG
jgi:thiamine biosynthesis lipoprotein